jgi:hypothetical protein
MRKLLLTHRGVKCAEPWFDQKVETFPRERLGSSSGRELSVVFSTFFLVRVGFGEDKEDDRQP